MGLEDEDDELFANCEKDFDDDLIMEWARVSLFSFFLDIYYFTYVML